MAEESFSYTLVTIYEYIDLLPHTTAIVISHLFYRQKSQLRPKVPAISPTIQLTGQFGNTAASWRSLYLINIVARKCNMINS
jgi:hypothetical protein